MEDQQASRPNVIEQLAEACGGKITEVGGPLSDGSGFAIMSMPLRKDHWIYKGDREETYGTFNVPPMPLRMGSADIAKIFVGSGARPADKQYSLTKNEFAEMLKAAGKYAVRCATMNGKDMDFDPDALLQNLQVGMLGYWTDTGLSEDEWANPAEGD
jgi:hypothetical protein